MPLGPGVRYRFKNLGGGRKQRLAFKGNKVVESVMFHKGEKGKLVKGDLKAKMKERRKHKQ